MEQTKQVTFYEGNPLAEKLREAAQLELLASAPNAIDVEELVFRVLGICTKPLKWPPYLQPFRELSPYNFVSRGLQECLEELAASNGLSVADCWKAAVAEWEEFEYVKNTKLR